MATKNVKLRAFKFGNPQLGQAEIGIKPRLYQALEKTKTSQERCMLLNEADEAKEQDLISNYQMNSEEQSLFCTLMRIAPGNNIQHITNSLLDRKVFDLDALENQQLETAAIYKQHFDFAVNGDYLVTNLPGNITVKRLQTYLAFFLKDETIGLTPLIKESEDLPLSDIQKIVFNGNPILPSGNEQQTKSTVHPVVRTFQLAKDVLLSHMKDAASLQNIDWNEIISAELLIKFKNQKKIPESVKKTLEAVFKPVSDIDQISIYSKKGNKIIAGQEVLRVKTVSIEMTESGHISEQALAQEMAIFLKELMESQA